MSQIVIYTDGGCRSNHSEKNIGAWAYTVSQGDEESCDYGVELNTTNNIQEMKACIEALKTISTYDSPTEIQSDSAYVVNGMNNWVHNWKKNGWTRGKHNDKPLMNLELWKELDELRCIFRDLKFVKVKGHSTNEGNNKVDELVNIAMDEYLANNMLHEEMSQ